MTAWRRQSATGAGSSTTANAVMGSTPLPGSFLVAVVAVNAASPAFAVANGYSGGTVGTNTDSICVFWKTAGVEGTSQQPCTNANVGWCCEVTEYVGGHDWAKNVENAAAAGTSATHTSPTVTPNNSGATLVVGGVQSSTAGGSPFSNQQVNASATGVSVVSDQGANGTSLTVFDKLDPTPAATYATKAQASLGNAGTAAVAVFSYLPASPAPGSWPETQRVIPRRRLL